MKFAFALLLAAGSSLNALGQDAFELQKDVTYVTRNDTELKLDVYRPKAANTELRPGVLVVHGGAWRHGNRKQLAGYATDLAKRGYVCFAISYRLAPKHPFPAQLEDCHAAVTFIRERAKEYQVDPNRLGAVGYSAGGHLVSLLATRGEESDSKNTKLQAVVAGGAPTEFRFMPDGGKGLSYWLGEAKADNVNHKNASATAFVSADDCPVFFFNGDKDRVVPLMWTRPLFDSLKKAGVPVEMYEIEGAGHLQAAGDPKALEAAWNFFDQHLKELQESVAIESSPEPQPN